MKQIVFFPIFPMVILCYAAYALIHSAFLGKHLECTKAGKRIFSAVFFLGSVVMGMIFEIWYIPFFITALLRHVLFCLLVMAVFRSENEKKFFASVMLIAADVLAGNFSDSLISCMVLFLKNTIKTRTISYISMEDGFLIGCLSYMTVVLVIWRLSQYSDSLFRNKVKSWYVLLSVPLIFIVLIMDIVNYGASIGIMVVSDVNGAEYWNVYHNELFSHIAICILTALSMCAAMVYVFGMNRIYMEQKKKEQYQMQAAFYQMQEEQYSQMERLRHDMKNHVIGLHGLWENGEWEKIGSYLEKMMESGALEKGEVATGSRVVDALLFRKRKQAEAENILWECDVQIPESCTIDEFDLCVLLGNILDNALEACGRFGNDRNKFVNIYCKKVKKCLLLEVKNSTGMTDLKEIKSTKKENPKEHGIGFLNIRETVYQYNGCMNTEVENGIFSISVLLPLNEAIYDNKQTTYNVRLK